MFYLNRLSEQFCEQAAAVRFEVHVQAVVVFGEKQYMVLEYERHIIVEFQYGGETADQETLERGEIVELIHHNFNVVGREVVVWLQQLHEIRNIELLAMLGALAVILVYLFYDFFCDHVSVRY